ncbi:MAG: hypothetical protein QM751_09260 [Paludibacteraceae bacterium]
MTSCDKNDDTDAEANYSVLGITSITINGLDISIKNDGILLDLTDHSEIANTGLLNEPTNKHVELNYTILASNTTSPSVQVQSRYSDTSVNLVQTQESQVVSYSIHVTRKGYQERVTYVLHFKNI